MKRFFFLLVVVAGSLMSNVAYGETDVFNIDSIDRLYVKDTDLALKQLAVLRQRCERNGWKECSKTHLEAIETLSHEYRGDVRNTQRHALAAIAHSGSKDMFWKLVSYHALCSTLALDGNWALLGKYSQMMEQEAKQAGNQWFVAQAEIYSAFADGYSDETDKALAKMDKAVETYQTSFKAGNKIAHFNAIILRYEALNAKIDLCMRVGKNRLAEKFIAEGLAGLDNDERTGDTPMDREGFAVNRMSLYAKRANVYHVLGKDGEPWCQQALTLLGKYQDAGVVSLLADYLYATRQYSTWEKIVPPLLSNITEREPDTRTMRIVWQYIDILSKTGRTDSITVWTSWGMKASNNLQLTAYKDADEGFTLAYKAESQKKELKLAKLQLSFIATLAVILAAAVVVFFILWRKLRQDKDYLISLINENQKKGQLAGMLLKSETAGEGNADSADLNILSRLHTFLTTDDLFRKSDNLITACSQELGISTRKLNAVLQKTRGVTLSGYIRDLRLDHACAELRDKPQLTVEAIALDSGYNSLRPFLQAFKGKYNITPTAYRRGGGRKNILRIKEHYQNLTYSLKKQHYMKKFLLLLCLTTMVTAYAINHTHRVGDNPDYQFIKIKFDSLFSQYKDPITGNIITSIGDDFHVGDLYKFIRLNTIKHTDSVPEKSDCYLYVTDIYGFQRLESHYPSIITAFIKDLPITSLDISLTCPLTRGGRYYVDFGMEGIEYHSKDTISVRSEPTILSGDLSTTVGENAKVVTYYTTGYPYDMDDTTGKKCAKYQISYWENDSTLVPTEYNDSVTLRLKDVDHPLIEGIDTLEVSTPSLKPGKYHWKVDTDWGAGTKEFDFDVCDTLRVTAAFEKDKYLIRDSTKQDTAKLLLHLERTYPYIKTNYMFPKPFVKIRTSLIDYKIDFWHDVDVADDSLQYKPLNMDTEIDIPLSDLINLQSDEYVMNFRVLVTINGDLLYSQTLPMYFYANEDAVSQIRTNTVSQNKKETTGIYGIDGKKYNII